MYIYVLENGENLLPGGSKTLSHAYRRSCVAFNVNGVVLSIFFNVCMYIWMYFTSPPMT